MVKNTNAKWEAEEAKMRDFLGANVSILRNRTDGRVKPLTLEELRRRVRSQPELFDDDDQAACGCFTPESDDG